VKINATLRTFDSLDFAAFVAELKKQKIKLSLVQQDELEDYFNQYAKGCRDISHQIVKADQEINILVYQLYGLTYDEILVVDPDTTFTREEYEQG
jgi:methionine synthase II (cobalamin-independent)